MIVIVLLFASVSGASSDWPTIFEAERNNRVVKLYGIGEREVVYQSTKGIWRDPRVSPDGRYLAIIEFTDGVLDGPSYSVPPKNNLVICDTLGDLLHAIDDDVRRLSWSPDGSQIAYITGGYYEGGRGFRGTGIYVYNLSDETRTPIRKDYPHEMPDRCSGIGYDLNWAVHDSNLYVQENDYCGGCYLFDPRNGDTRPVPYKGIHFSPDGKFYMDINIERGHRLFESADNQDITAEVESVYGYLPTSWIPGRDHHLYGERIAWRYVAPDSSSAESTQQDVYGNAGEVRAVEEKHLLIYDVESRQVVEDRVEEL